VFGSVSRRQAGQSSFGGVVLLFPALHDCIGSGDLSFAAIFPHLLEPGEHLGSQLLGRHPASLGSFAFGCNRPSGLACLEVDLEFQELIQELDLRASEPPHVALGQLVALHQAEN
jgi:hypothetical protein